MKKYFLSLLVTPCLTVAAPAVFAAGEADLQSQIDSAADGAVIVLSGDVTVGSTLTINKPLTINGANHKLTYTGSGAAITAYPGMSDSEMANWFSSHVTGWSSVMANVPPYVEYAARTALKPYIPHEGGKI